MTAPQLLPLASGIHHRLLTPEIYTEPDIDVVGVVLHRHGTWGAKSLRIGDWFDREDVLVESHTSYALDGQRWQFQLFGKQADAQGDGNGWRGPDGRLKGYVSFESEDADRWTQAQLISMGIDLAWLSTHHRFPLAAATAPRSGGVGYHAQFPQWNRNHHNCPDAAHVAQIPELLRIAIWFAGLAASEPSLTQVVDEVWTLDGKTGLALQRDGGVISLGERKIFHGSFPGLPEHQRQGVHRFGDIEFTPDGYVLTDTCPEHHTYHFGVAA